MNENLKRAFDAAQNQPDDTQNVIAEHILADIEQQGNFSKIPFDEGMKAYRKVKEQYDDLFRELAKL